MGLFGKDRFGTIAVAPNKRDIKWVLPNWTTAFTPGAYDSICFDNHLGHELHFHLVVDQNANGGQNVSNFLHYKNSTLGKYSFFFTTPALEEERARDPSGASLSTRLTVHTALNIPQGDGDIRVGHYGVTTKAALDALVAANPAKNKGELWILFYFDDDTITRTEGNEADCKFAWKIPRFKSKLISPLTSKIFLVNGLNFVVRMDRKRGPNQNSSAAAAASATDENANSTSATQQQHQPVYTIFLFSRRSAFPPHNIALVAANGGKIAVTEDRDDMSSRILTVPADILSSAVQSDGSVQFELEFKAGGNPLDGAFNAPAAAAPAIKSDRPATVPGCSSGTVYTTVVPQDEI